MSDLDRQIRELDGSLRVLRELRDLFARLDALRVDVDLDSGPTSGAPLYQWRVTHRSTSIVFVGGTLLDGLRDAIAYLDALADPSSRPGLVIDVARVDAPSRTVA